MKTNGRSLQQWLDTLYRRRRFGIKPGLSMINALLRAAGDPCKELRIIHVAGTNGKGSVCAMLGGALSAAGLRTGVYTSPHLVRFNERICIDGLPISDAALAECARDLQPAIEYAEKQCGCDATFFEVTTALAFEYFRRQCVDWAVIETGLGGRLDATNAVLPQISVITSIGLDHQAYLGDTIAEIAVEKAGIIKAGVPVVTGRLCLEAEKVIKQTAAGLNAPYFNAEELVEAVSAPEKTCPVYICDGTAIECRSSMRGVHQRENVSTTLAVLIVLQRKGSIPLMAREWGAGVSTVVLRARCELLKAGPPPVWLDAGHNVSAASSLAEMLQKDAAGRRVALVLGMSSDKDAAGYLAELKDLITVVWAVEAEDERAMPKAQLAGIVARAGLAVSVAELPEAIRCAEKWAEEHDGAVLIGGSFFLAGDVLKYLKQAMRA